MVFSFFKKKEKQPEEKMPESVVVRPKQIVVPEAKVAPLVSDETVQVNQNMSLPYIRPTQMLTDLYKAPDAPVSRIKPLDSEFLLPDSKTQLSLRRASNAQLVRHENVDQASTISEFERNFTESSVMDIDLDQGVDPVQADVEQVAVLFANGQDTLVRSLLEGFVRSTQGEDALRFWAMYFDFLQLMDDRATFDLMGLLFAEQCEKSPPPWQSRQMVAPLLWSDEAVFDLQGVLTEDTSQVLQPILASIEKKTPVRLMCHKLLGCDDVLSGQLAIMLQRARLLNVAVVFKGVERLIASLQIRMVNGQRNNEASWRLCFELLQRTGAHAAFEECAVEFAVTFEQSPPSWIPVESAVAATQRPELPKDAYYLSGEIRSCKFDDLKPVFEKFRLPILDFSGVRRMDFFSAGQLANRLGIFRHGGREIVIRSPNHLVAELMGVVGINKYARILVPKS